MKDGSQNETVAGARVALRPDLRSSWPLPRGWCASRCSKPTSPSLRSAATPGQPPRSPSTTASSSSRDARSTSPPAEIADLPLTLTLSLPTCPHASTSATWCRAHSLVAVVSDARPSEFDTANDIDSAPIDVRVYDGDGVVVTEESHAPTSERRPSRAGGNAIDAAAVVQFALSVTRPHTTGIGGGCTMLVHFADGENFAIDAREKAPAAADPTMFVGRTPLDDAKPERLRRRCPRDAGCGRPHAQAVGHDVAGRHPREADPTRGRRLCRRLRSGECDDGGPRGVPARDARRLPPAYRRSAPRRLLAQATRILAIRSV